MHRTIDLPIYYFGTPVILISTQNDDGSTNIAPSSSIWWLGKSCMVGLDGSSRTTENLKRTRECVINLPSADRVDAVNRLANTTGSPQVPLHKKLWGYRHEKDKLGLSGMTVEPAHSVNGAKIVECPVQLEVQVENIHPFAAHHLVPMFAFEMRIVQCHLEESILTGEHLQYVDPDRWHPLIMSFRRFYSTHDSLCPSRLEQAVSVERYRVREQDGLAGRVVKALFRRLYRQYRAADA